MLLESLPKYVWVIRFSHVKTSDLNVFYPMCDILMDATQAPSHLEMKQVVFGQSRSKEIFKRNLNNTKAKEILNNSASSTRQIQSKIIFETLYKLINE